jgi:hypothetical protein
VEFGQLSQQLSQRHIRLYLEAAKEPLVVDSQQLQ